MIEKKHSGSLFKKYFLYYITILMVPVIILGIGICAYLYQYHARQTAQHNEKFSYLVRSTLDETFGSIHAVNEALLAEQFSDGWSGKDSYFSAYQEQKALHQIKEAAIPFSENIILLRAGTSSILSSQSTYSRSTFYNRIYRSPFPLETLTTGVELPLVIPIESYHNSMIAYVLPGSRSASRNVNVYTVPYSYFDKLLRSSALSGSQIYLISGRDHSILYHYGTLDQPDPDTLFSDSRIVSLDGQMYLRCSLPSNSSPVHYIVLTPLSQEFQDLILLLSLYLLCTMLILASGFALAYHLARKNTRPIEDLTSLVHQKLDALPSRENALDTLALAFHMMDENIQNMKNIIDDTNDDVIYISIMKLLTGEISSLDQINRLLAPKDIHLEQKYYTVAVFESGAPSTRKRTIPGVTYQEDQVGEDRVQTFFLNSYDTPYLYAIIVTPSAGCNMQEYLHTTSRRLFRILAADITVGYAGSSFYFSEISSHFHQCLMALDYKFITGKGNLVDFREISRSEPLDHQRLDFQKFYQLLVSGSSEDLISYINDYYIHISAAGYSDVRSVKIRIFGLFNFLYDTFPSLVADYQKSSGSLLEHSETAEDYLNYICYLSLNLQKQLRASSSNDRFAQINRFIEENLTDVCFSVQWVADHFGMSTSTLSKYYKSVAGINISEQINRLRMEKAIELLLGTELTVNEIVSAVGYANASSFIRKFKEYTSLTPGKYREVHRSQTK